MKDQLYFEQYWFLLLLIFPLIILVYIKYLTHRQPTLTVTTITKLPPRRLISITPPGVLLTIRLIALSFIIMALANFRLEKTVKHKKLVGGANIILAVDVSKSMQIEDIKPNRLEALKSILSQFIASRSTDSIGIVLYAGESVYWCPLTKDHSFLIKKLAQINDYSFLDGTAIGVGLASAANALKAGKNANKIIILLTDGENNAGYVDPLTAAAVAKKLKIKVYTIGIGKNGTASLPVYDSNGQRKHIQIAVSIDEPMLKAIAATTGGVYFNATDATGLQRVYSHISRLEKSVIAIVQEVIYIDMYRIYTAIAIFLLVIELITKYTLFKLNYKHV